MSSVTGPPSGADQEPAAPLAVPPRVFSWRKPSTWVPKQAGPPPAWWFKDGVFVVIVGLLIFSFQSYVNDGRERASNRVEAEQSFREAIIREGQSGSAPTGAATAPTAPHFDRSYTAMQGMNLAGIALPGAILVEADLGNAVLRNAVLKEADLTLADLDGAQMQGSILIGATLDGASLNGADLTKAELGCPLPADDAHHGDRQCAGDADTKLRLTKLIGADLHRASFQGADMWKATLIGADLGGANMRETKLGGVNAQEAQFDCAEESNPSDVENPVLTWCVDLRGATLWNADLRGADLSGADLTGARLNGAILGNTAFDRSRLRYLFLPDANLDGTKLDDICYDETTVWPLGFTPPPARDRSCPTRKTLERDVQSVVNFLERGDREGAAGRALSVRCAQWEGRTKWIDDVAARVDELDADTPKYTVGALEPGPGGITATVRWTASASEASGPAPERMIHEDDKWKFDPCPT